MKKSWMRLLSVIMAVCLCASMVPGAAMAASVPAIEKLNMSIGQTKSGSDTYDITYKVKLSISDAYAKLVSVNKGDASSLKELRFVCVLKDGLVKQLSTVTKDDFAFSGEGAANFDFISIEKQNTDEIHITYKLNEDIITSWKTMKTADVKDALQKEMVMSSTKTATVAQLDEATKDGMIKTEGQVRITSVDGRIPGINKRSVVAAEGYAILRRGSADPDETGISAYLNTKDHIAFMVGDDKGNFRPNDCITRAEMAQIFYALLKNKNVKITVKFDDVPENVWYSTAVNTLASLGRVAGVGNNKFDPNRPITRAEFATIAAGFAKNVDMYFDFEDVPETHWAYRGVTIAAVNGWVCGIGDNQFDPNRPITRAEAAAIVNHMLGRLGDDAAIDAGQGRQFPDVTKSHWAWYEIGEATFAHEYEMNADHTKETWKK